MVEIPSLETRDPSVMMTNKTSHWTFCDVYAIDTNTWYKSGIPMTTQCPSMYMCGAKFPIWMNGSYMYKCQICQKTKTKKKC
jgi:hypothetical protein